MSSGMCENVDWALSDSESDCGSCDDAGAMAPVAAESTACGCGLLLFYNVVSDGPKRGSKPLPVKEWFGLEDGLWRDVDFDKAVVVDHCSVGVPASGSVKASDRLSDVFTCAVALVRCNGYVATKSITECRVKAGAALCGYAESSVAFIPGSKVGRLDEDSLKAISRRKINLYSFLEHFEWNSSLMSLMRQQAVQHAELLEHASRQEKRSKLAFHKNGNRAFRQALQRLLYFHEHEKEVPLECSPCQLGWSDAQEWVALSDPCRSSKSTSFGDFLSRACTCGRVGVKASNKLRFDGSGVGAPIPEAEWKSILLHNLKESALQTLVGGRLTASFRGQLAPHSGNPEVTRGELCYFVPEGVEAPSDLPMLRNHLCFVVESARLHRLLDAEFCLGLMRDVDCLDSKESLAMLLQRLQLRKLVACGEIHVAGPWSSTGTLGLHLPLGSALEGEVLLLVGDYAGPQIYAMESILRHREAASRIALRRIFSSHLPSDACTIDQGRSLLRKVTVAKVHESLKMELTSHQAAVVERVFERPIVEAVAGSGKSTIGIGVVLAMLPDVGSQEKIVWLTPTRAQRDETLRSIREFLDDPLWAAALGRLLHEAPADGDDQLVDSLTEDKLRESLQLHYDMLDQLDAAQRKLQHVTDDSSVEWQQRKELAEARVRAEHKLEHARLGLVQKHLETTPVLVMTLDCFNQVMSNRSVLSPQFEGVRIHFAVVDEAHQLEPASVGAVACAVDDMMVFWDRAQQIDHSQRVVLHRRKAGGFSDLGSGCYSWDQLAGLEGTERELLWHWISPRMVSNLPVTLRFGANVCRFLRSTSVDYGQVNKIWAPEELDERDEVAVRRTPSTQMQTALYQSNLFHVKEQDGSVSWKPVVVGALRDANADSDNEVMARCRVEDVSSPACRDIAASEHMFLAMAHEGLTLLAQLESGRIKGVGCDALPVLSLFYKNACRDEFEILVECLLRDEKICAAYGFPLPARPSKVWRVLTPQAASGRSCVLAQVALLPRESRGQDLLGHMKDPKRHVIVNSRSRRYLSHHVSAGCMDSKPMPEIWQKHFFPQKRVDYSCNWLTFRKNDTHPFIGSRVVAWLDGSDDQAIEAAARGHRELLRAALPFSKQHAEMSAAFGELSAQNTRCRQAGFAASCHVALASLMTRSVVEEVDQPKTTRATWIPSSEFMASAFALADSLLHGARQYWLAPVALKLYGNGACVILSRLRVAILPEELRVLRDALACILIYAVQQEAPEGSDVVVHSVMHRTSVALRWGASAVRVRACIEAEVFPRVFDAQRFIISRMSWKLAVRVGSLLHFMHGGQCERSMIHYVPRPSDKEHVAPVDRAEHELRTCIEMARCTKQLLDSRNPGHFDQEAKPARRKVAGQRPLRPDDGTKRQRKADAHGQPAEASNPSTSHQETAVAKQTAYASSNGAEVPLPVRVCRKIGVDIGGVLVVHRHDWPRVREPWHRTCDSAVAGALDGVRHLVGLLGASNVHLISYAKGAAKRNIKEWIDTVGLLDATGVLRNNVHFCRSRRGPEGKGPIAQRLQLTDFIDDCDKNLAAVYKDPDGNTGKNIDALPGVLIHFARSGKLRCRPARPFVFDGVLPACLKEASSWEAVLRSF